MYKAIVKWNGNHYSSGEEVKGSKIRQNQDGTVELFDDEPSENFPYYGSAREEWVEVEPDSISNLNDEVVFKLDNSLVQRQAVQQPNFLFNYCKNIKSAYEVNIEIINNKEVIITGPARNIQALIYDGMFADLVDMTDGNTEQQYDEQHGQEYYGLWY